MKIVTYDRVRIEGAVAGDKNYVFLDSVKLVGDYGAGVAFYPEFHHVVIAYNKDERRYALVAMPSKEWEDSFSAGWTIVQRLSVEKESR